MADRFEQMSVFVAVCDQAGFAPAARRLGLSASVVTRQVAALEDRLGTRLLHRTTRSLRLTEAGGLFLDRARRLLGELEDAEWLVQDRQAEPRGRLTIAAPLLFGRIHVAPTVSAFLAAWPRASAELLLSDRPINLIEDGVDIAVRIGPLAESGLIARRLGQTRRVLVASPTYLRDRPPLHAPADLAQHDLVAFGALARSSEWPFGPAAGGQTVRVTPRFVTDSGDVAIAHALADGGLTFALCYQVVEPLRDGRLVTVLAAFDPPPMPIHAVVPSARLISPKVRVFRDLLDQAAAGGAWQF